MNLELRKSAAGYALIDHEGRQRPLSIDFADSRLIHRVNGGGKELLVKAVGARAGLRVFDCTAGLGVDAFLLASKGCEIQLCERSHTLYLMLEDALLRAGTLPTTADIASRMTLLRGEAKGLLSTLTSTPDVITIDPMFPLRRKAAEVKGSMQRLQKLIGKDENTAGLILAARATGCRRVVVKRPLRAAAFDGLTPTFTVNGRASRFDVYCR